MDLVDEEDGALGFSAGSKDDLAGKFVRDYQLPVRSNNSRYNSRFALLQLAGFGDDAAQVGDAGGDGGDGDEVGGGLGRDDAGERRLAGARRAPEDDGRQMAGLDEAAQELARRDEVVLADVLVEAAGAHAGGQRRAGGVFFGRSAFRGEQGLLGEVSTRRSARHAPL